MAVKMRKSCGEVIVKCEKKCESILIVTSIKIGHLQKSCGHILTSTNF